MTMRILHITFDMAIGGTEQVIRQLVENLHRDDFESFIYCIDGKIGALGELLKSQGVSVYGQQTRNPGLDMSLVRHLKSYLREQQIDIVHCHQYTPYVYGLFAALGSPVKVLFTEHGRFYPDSYKWKRYLVNPLLSLFTGKITAISKATAKALVKYENFPRSKISVVYNGMHFEIDPELKNQLASIRDEYGLPDSAFLYGTISRLDSIKNQKMMIAAFARVARTHPQSRLLIIGDGPERQTLERQVKALNVDEKVIFTGFKTNPKPWFHLMDAFLLSSFSEGTSMTLLEAMACGKPSVVTNVGGNPEIVEDNLSGLICPNDDTEAFHTAMRSLIDDPSLAKRLGEAGRQRYQEQFSVSNMCREYQNIYQSLAEKKT